MQPFPVAYMPITPPPCFTLRSRRETNTIDTVNSRLFEHAQTDSPALLNSLRGVNGSERYQDMNPIPSRLYREDMRQAQPYVVPSHDSEHVKSQQWFQKQISATLDKIQTIAGELAIERKYDRQSELRKQIATYEDTYKLLLAQQKALNVDTLSKNPYFEKYDVKDDSRNIVREVRGCVTEDVVDRGVVESQKLYKREFENRWLPANFSETQRLDSLSAYELMRPKFNDQGRTYN